MKITYIIALTARPSFLTSLSSKLDGNVLLMERLASSPSKESCLKWIAEYLQKNPKAQLTIVESYEFEEQKPAPKYQFSKHAEETKPSLGFWNRKTKRI